MIYIRRIINCKYLRILAALSVSHRGLAAICWGLNLIHWLIMRLTDSFGSFSSCFLSLLLFPNNLELFDFLLLSSFLLINNWIQLMFISIFFLDNLFPFLYHSCILADSLSSLGHLRRHLIHIHDSWWCHIGLYLFRLFGDGSWSLIILHCVVTTLNPRKQSVSLIIII